MFKKSEETVMLYLAFIAAGLCPDWKLLVNFDWELKWVFEYGYFTTGKFVFYGTTFKQVANLAYKEGWKVNRISFYSSMGYSEQWSKWGGYHWDKDADPVKESVWLCNLMKDNEEITVFVYSER